MFTKCNMYERIMYIYITSVSLFILNPLDQYCLFHWWSLRLVNDRLFWFTVRKWHLIINRLEKWSSGPCCPSTIYPWTLSTFCSVVRIISSFYWRNNIISFCSLPPGHLPINDFLCICLPIRFCSVGRISSILGRILCNIL